MVLHGYKLPGRAHGTRTRVVGECVGVGAPAYELSADGCKEYRRLTTDWLAATKQHLRAIKDGTVRDIVRRSRSGALVTIGNDDPRFEVALREAKRDDEFDIKTFTSEIARMDALIKSWRPRSVLRGTEAIEAKAGPERIAARAERVTAKTARDAKASALAIKRAAKEAELETLRPQREALVADFRKRLQKLAMTPGEASRIAALKIIREIQRKDSNRYGDIGGVMGVLDRVTFAALFPAGKMVDFRLSDEDILDSQR